MSHITMTGTAMEMAAETASMDSRTLSRFNRGCQLVHEGRVQDREEAAALIRDAAERSGAAVAQYNLGALYENGLGVPLDLVLAVSWYSKAAAQGRAWQILLANSSNVFCTLVSRVK